MYESLYDEDAPRSHFLPGFAAGVATAFLLAATLVAAWAAHVDDGRWRSHGRWRLESAAVERRAADGVAADAAAQRLVATLADVAETLAPEQRAELLRAIERVQRSD